MKDLGGGANSDKRLTDLLGRMRRVAGYSGGGQDERWSRVYRRANAKYYERLREVNRPRARRQASGRRGPRNEVNINSAEVDRMLAQLPEQIENNIVRGAMFRGAKAVAARARKTTLFKDKNEVLRPAIGVRHVRGDVAAVAGAFAPHAHLVEFGTARGAAPTNFFYTAAKEAESEVLRLVTDYCKRRLHNLRR